MKSDELLGALNLIARVVARHVVEELRCGDLPGWLDQSSSPLGNRRHAAACRRRIAAGDGTAAQIGRRFLMTREAVREELAAASAKTRPRVPAKPNVRAELERELALHAVEGRG